MLAKIDKVGRHFALHLPPSVLGNRDATRFSHAFKPCRDVDTVAKDIITLNNDIANVDPDPKPDWIAFCASGVVVPKLFLNFGWRR